MAALPIAAGVIYPAGQIRLDPVWASLAMALSYVYSVIPSANERLTNSLQIGICSLELSPFAPVPCAESLKELRILMKIMIDDWTT